MYKYTFNLASGFFFSFFSEKSEITEAQTHQLLKAVEPRQQKQEPPQAESDGRRLLDADRNHRDKEQK